MPLYRLERVQRLNIPLEGAWAFFSNPASLGRITPAWLDFTITSHPPAEIHPGLIITYLIRPFGGWSWSWVSEITHMDAPRAFVDEQRLGPFRFWHHRHTLAQIDGGVEMRDSVHYALPLGPFGRMLHATLVRPRLERIFDFRRRTLDQLFNAPPLS